MEKIIDYNAVARLSEYATDVSEVKGSYIVLNLTAGNHDALEIESMPQRVGGTLWILMRGGSPWEVEINLESHTVKPDTLILGFPNMLIQFKEALPRDVEAYVMFFDVSFIQNINLNLTSIPVLPIAKRPDPIGRLTGEYVELLTKYIDLLGQTAAHNIDLTLTRNVAASLVAAMMYQLIQFYMVDVIDTATDAALANTPQRRSDYVRDFMKLVHRHFIRERSVSFYADKLFISPKYLSLLVKEATGRSASRWIDDFVVMEAKNMLRYSGKNIQQVAYALNFTTQSSFGKYFKHLTGMSPTEYQKS